MKTLLITGGAGFVGSNLAIRYKEDNPDNRVVAFDNLKRRGSELNIQRLRQFGVEFVHGDIRNKEDLESIGPFDLMFECAAEPSVLAGYGESPAYLINTNLRGTINCLEVVRRHRAGIVFLSTSRVYPAAPINALDYVELDTRFDLEPEQTTAGASDEGIAEDFPLHGSRSLYGATKLASEILLEEYLDAYDLRGVVNRCGVLTGPWQMGKVDQGFVVLWVAKHFFNKELAYFGFGGKGKQVRDILHIDDLYALLVKQLAQLDSISGTVYNVGGGREVSTSLAEMTALCAEITGNAIPISSVDDDRQADLIYYVSDCRKVRSALDWQPQKSVRETVSEIAEWIRLNQTSLEPILA